MHVRSIEGEEKVTPLELFFDLVFVFAITQVTGFLAANETGEGLFRGFLLLAALWWAWEAYAWLTNTLDPEEGAVRLAFFARRPPCSSCRSRARGIRFERPGVRGGVRDRARAPPGPLHDRRPRRSRALGGGLPVRAGRRPGPILLVLAATVSGPAQMVLWGGP